MPIVGEMREKVIITPHPGGVKGAMLSLDAVADKMWRSRNDPRVRSWATQQLAKAGSPTGARDKAQVLLDAYRAKVPYVPDPVQSEFMASPIQTLCLDDHGVCIIGGDCDDATITVGACLLSIGIPVQVVGASYKDPIDQPVHVYLQFQDDAGLWVPADATTKFEVGNVHQPARTWIVDPNKGVGAAGLPGGDFVSVGKAPGGSASRPATAGGIVAPGGRRVAAFGLGLVTPGDVLSYRAAWNNYVLDTVRCAQACAQAYNAVAATETDPTTKALLTKTAQATQKGADALLAQWNVYANTDNATLVIEASTILQGHQQTVLSAGQTRQSITTGSLSCSLVFTDSKGQIVQATPGVDPSVQAQIISRIEGLGILASGVLQILVETGGNSLQAVGSAAKWSAEQVSRVTSALATPWPWLAIMFGAGAVIVWELRR